MPKILIARGSREALEATRVLDYGELFFEKVQPDEDVQDGTLDIGSEDQVEPNLSNTKS